MEDHNESKEIVYESYGRKLRIRFMEEDCQLHIIETLDNEPQVITLSKSEMLGALCFLYDDLIEETTKKKLKINFA